MTAEEYKEKYNITIEGFDIDYVTTQEESDPCSTHQFATMINIKKLFSSFFTAVFVVVGLGGCQADTDTRQVDTEQTVQETQQITETTADQAEQIIDEIETISAETTSDLLIETETEKNNSNDGVFTIDSDVYPLDSEEINISIDMSRNIYGESKYSPKKLSAFKKAEHINLQ